MHRWLKMSKYLVDMDIDLTVYTPSNPEYPAIDESTLADVRPEITIWKHPIREPYAWYKRFTGKRQEQKIYSGFINDKPSWTQRLSVWIRGNFFIPDARMMWIKPSIKYLTKRLKSEKIDCIVSTGPPHSMHRIALGLKRKFPTIKWIADFRDPWTGIDFYDQLQLSARADQKHRRMEREVLLEADEVVTVTPTWVQDLSELGNGRSVRLILNGYDTADFTDEQAVNEQFTIRHFGSINTDRDPCVLWKAMRKLADQGLVFDVDLFGVVDGSVKASVIKHGLQDQVKFRDFVPHALAIQLMQSSPALLLIINNTAGSSGIIPGKAYEYIGSGRPVLCIAPHSSDTSKVIGKSPSVHIIDYSEVGECEDKLKMLIAGHTHGVRRSGGINAYSRKHHAETYASLIQNSAN